MVFSFVAKHHADYFEELLKGRHVHFERFFDEEADPPCTLFGVNKSYLDTAMNANYLVHAKFRKPFIQSSLLKWVLLIVTGTCVALGILGYIKSH
jgi:hypothetical protein